MNKKINIIITLILLIILGFRFYSVFNIDHSDLVKKYSGQNIEVIGTIINEPQIKDFNQTFTVKTDEFITRVTTDRYIEYNYGDRIKMKGKISTPRNFKSNGGRTFDYINFLLKDGIIFEMKKPNIEMVGINEGNYISKNLFKLKQAFLLNLKRVLGEPHSALAGGLVVGEKGALGKDLIDDFRKSGLIHIVVLSGYNITIVADSIRRILSFLPRVIGIILGALGILLFGILVGGGATVVRSCIMAIIALFGSLIRRDYNVGKALFIAGVLMLIQNPLILFYDPSFQLSFLATLGLLFFSSSIESKLNFITESFGIRGLVASTLATQIFVSPYILYMMGQLSIIGIIVNILVLPIIPMTMFFVFFTGLIGFVSQNVSQFFGWVSHLLLSYELFMVRFFASLPFSSIQLPKFSFAIVIGFYLSYFVMLVKLPSTFSQLIFRKKSST